ncbi:Pentatricopeptide repeat [Quillaja saponaria]|uniref:Pentatricopeptide repeat n=1 Tax=Quillaja saponaria TaxID=32244 RepID=A0AAD7LVC0_QUISA|nr:Pentatricopeptide repeat [Quillaja saponaria]
MATSVLPYPYAINSFNLTILQKNVISNSPICHSVHARKFGAIASPVKECQKISRITETHQRNGDSFTGYGSVVRNGVLNNVGVLLHSMDFTNPDECVETYAAILQNCRKHDTLELGFQVHAHLIVCGVELCAFIGSQLLEMYCKLGHSDDARKLFDKMPEKNVFSWTSMMEMYCGLGYYEETINLFNVMIDEGIRPDHFVFPKVFKACSKLRDYQAGKDAYDYMLNIKFEGNAWVKRSALDMFVKCGKMDIARRLFEETKNKDIIMWNMMVAGYATTGEFKKALQCISDMKLEGVMPDHVTWNSIITGYGQDGKLKEASKYFMKMVNSDYFKPNVVSWSALIAGHEQNGYSSEALREFRNMIINGAKPNSITISSVISACTKLSLIRHGKEIHGYCMKTADLGSDLLVDNSLVDFYTKCQSLKVARLKFSAIKEKDVVSWNAMLAGYASRGCHEEAIELLNEMELQGVEPDIVTWNGLITGCTRNKNGKIALELLHRMCRMGINPNRTSITGALSACAQVKDLKLGKEIHGYVMRHHIELSSGVGSALITMYSGCDALEVGCCVFNELPMKDVVIWNSIISAYVQNGKVIEALYSLRDMNVNNVKPDSITMISALSACSKLAALYQGKEIHQFIIRHGLDASNFVCNALIDMYGRCGSIQKSRRIFDLMPIRDLVSWNVMISVYGMHGFGMDAINLFQYLRAMDEGWEYFKMIRTPYAMEPAIEQYACMVDLMTRAGHFDEALDFINKMPFEPNAAVWGSLLGACRIHFNPDLAELAAQHLFELEPQISGNYLLLANIYSAAGRWEDAAKIRCLMRERGVTKLPGCSWIEVKRKVHSFIVGDTSHPMMNDIATKMESLYFEIKKIGYVPDTNYVLKNVEEDEKEFSLCGHSEKLALAFGLISTPTGTPLRIIKNLRVCGDCHSATKYISKVEGREIIMRDNYRFHHFVNGVCSCGDYW